MQTKPKSNSVITHKVEGEVITFAVKDVGELMFDTTKVSEAVGNRAKIHGLIQRVSDAAAMSRAAADGELIPVAELNKRKFEAMRKLVEHYESGTEEWTLRSAGGGGTGEGILIQALALMYPEKTREALSAFVGKLKPVERTKLLNSDKVRPFAEQIRAELAKGIDAEEMLGALEAL
jgi:hypothetical protein